MSDSAKLQALLFLHGEPITLKKAMSVLKFTSEALQAALLELNSELQTEKSGLALLADTAPDKMFEGKNWESEKVQLVTKPDLAPLLTDFLKGEMSEELTPAGIEVASIIA